MPSPRSQIQPANDVATIEEPKRRKTPRMFPPGTGPANRSPKKSGWAACQQRPRATYAPACREVIKKRGKARAASAAFDQAPRPNQPNGRGTASARTASPARHSNSCPKEARAGDDDQQTPEPMETRDG